MKGVNERLIRWKRKILRRVLEEREQKTDIKEDEQRDLPYIQRAAYLQMMSHIERMADSSTLKTVAWKTPDYKKKNSRPRKSWQEALKKSFHLVCYTIERITGLLIDLVTYCNNRTLLIMVLIINIVR